jgi:hypothetical protein
MLDSVTESLTAGHERLNRREHAEVSRSSQSEATEELWEDCDSSIDDASSHTPRNEVSTKHSASKQSPKRNKNKNKNGSVSKNRSKNRSEKSPPPPPRKNDYHHQQACSNYRTQYQKYEEYHKLVLALYQDAQSEYRCPLSSVDRASLSDKDVQLLEFDIVNCQQFIDANIVDSYLLRIRAEAFQGSSKEAESRHAQVRERLQGALREARGWECREMRLEQLCALERSSHRSRTTEGSPTLSAGKSAQGVHVDIEQGDLYRDADAEDEDEVSNETDSESYIATPASLYIASLLMLLADHSLEIFMQKGEQLVDAEDQQHQLSLVKIIAEQYQEAIGIYKFCLGGTNLMVANILVHYASHLLSFIEYTSAQLSNFYTHKESASPGSNAKGGAFSFMTRLFSSREAQHVLPLRMAGTSAPPPQASPLPDNATVAVLETLHVRCQEEARELLEEAMVLFQLLGGGADSAVTCNAYDGRSSQFQVALGGPVPVQSAHERGCRDNTAQSVLSFTHTSARPVHVCMEDGSGPGPGPIHRGDLEANILLTHVYLYQEAGEEALAQCTAHVQRVKQQYMAAGSGSGAPVDSVLAPPTAASLDAMRSALRMQELEKLLSATSGGGVEVEVEVDSRSHVSGADPPLLHAAPAGCCVHTYVAEAYILQAHLLQSLDRLDSAAEGGGSHGRREEASESLLAALLVYRRLFGDRDEQFIWLERDPGAGASAGDLLCAATMLWGVGGGVDQCCYCTCVLCCAVLCCVVLCCVVLGCVVLCCVSCVECALHCRGSCEV